jgi:hypothetical protein
MEALSSIGGFEVDPYSRELQAVEKSMMQTQRTFRNNVVADVRAGFGGPQFR